MFALLFFAASLFLSCAEQPDANPELIAAEIEQQRAQKDGAFKSSPTSPIPKKDKVHFTGLAYYPVNLAYRFHLKLNKYREPKPITIITSTGMQREAEKYGYFEFEMAGEPCKLTVYRLLDIQSRFPGHLFVPFTDATTGKETYSGGRYIDLQQNPSGRYDLDFNVAYSPSCAYGKAGYNCPVPPPENRLGVSILAGEKKYPLAH